MVLIEARLFFCKGNSGTAGDKRILALFYAMELIFALISDLQPFRLLQNKKELFTEANG